MDGAIKWKCDARLNDAIRFDQVDVDCERAPGADDGNLVIDCSCRLVYSLKKVHATEREVLLWLVGSSLAALLLGLIAWVFYSHVTYRRASTKNNRRSTGKSARKPNPSSDYRKSSSSGMDYQLYSFDYGGDCDGCDSGGCDSGGGCGDGD